MTVLLIALVVLLAVAVVAVLIVANVQDYHAYLRFWRRNGTSRRRSDLKSDQRP